MKSQRLPWTSLAFGGGVIFALVMGILILVAGVVYDGFGLRKTSGTQTATVPTRGTALGYGFQGTGYQALNWALQQGGYQLDAPWLQAVTQFIGADLNALGAVVLYDEHYRDVNNSGFVVVMSSGALEVLYPDDLQTGHLMRLAITRQRRLGIFNAANPAYATRVADWLTAIQAQDPTDETAFGVMILYLPGDSTDELAANWPPQYFGPQLRPTSTAQLTLTPMPTATTTTLPPTQTPAASVQAIQSYWELVNASQYEAAWKRLSPGFQQSKHTGNYRHYVQGFQDMRFCSMTVKETALAQLTEAQAVVYTHLELRSGAACLAKTYDFTFSLIYDPATQTWLIDRVY